MKRGGSVSGAVSLVMIFCVLCLALFTTLTVTTANRERQLSELTATRTKEYYAADTIATDIAEQIMSGQSPENVTVTGSDADGTVLASYSVAINDDQTLEVVLAEKDGIWRVDEWKSVYTGKWEPDSDIDVWEGPEGEVK